MLELMTDERSLHTLRSLLLLFDRIRFFFQ